MTTDDFAYWLQGALELNPEMLKKGMKPEQVQMIQEHLDLVFTKVTKSLEEISEDPFFHSPPPYYDHMPVICDSQTVFC